MFLHSGLQSLLPPVTLLIFSCWNSLADLKKLQLLMPKCFNKKWLFSSFFFLCSGDKTTGHLLQWLIWQLRTGFQIHPCDLCNGQKFMFVVYNTYFLQKPYFLKWAPANKPLPLNKCPPLRQNTKLTKTQYHKMPLFDSHVYFNSKTLLFN